MKVLLRDDVAGVGRRGDIVKVAGGFARNFLLPEGRAIIATDGVDGQAEQMRRGRDLREAQDRGAAEAQATILAGATIAISARAGGGGRLFGSIGPADVVEAIKTAKGMEVDQKPHRPARAHQGGRLLRRDGGAVHRCGHRRDGRGDGRRLIREPGGPSGPRDRIRPTRPGVGGPCGPESGRSGPAFGPNGLTTPPLAVCSGKATTSRHTRSHMAVCPQARCSSTAFPQWLRACPTVIHTSGWVSHSSSGLRSPGLDRQSGGTVVQAFDDTRPRTCGLPRPPSSGARIPPHNLEAEESLLGAMLLSNDAASAAIEICTAGDFYKPAHGHIFGAIRALMERGEPIDAVTVTDELQRSGLLEAVGDPTVFISLQANTPSIANARHYAAIVEEHSLLRRLIGVAGDIADIGYSVPENVEGAIDEAEQMMFNVAERRTADTLLPVERAAGPGTRPY